MVLDYKLVPFGSSAVSKRGYRAVVDNDGFVRDTDDILIETADRFGIKPPQLRMCMEAVLDTMISKVADDGIWRRFGNYFTLRLDIKGNFKGRDSKPDGSQRPCFNMPRSAIGRVVMFTCHSRAGDPDAEMQSHSTSALVVEAI